VTPKQAIIEAVNIAHRNGLPRSRTPVRAEVDQCGVVRAYNEAGECVMFGHLGDWNEMRRALGVPTLEPVPVHIDGVEALYGIEPAPQSGEGRDE
jgi:hypothetical protein